MIYLFIIAGAILGGLLLEAEGIIPGMLGGYLFFRVHSAREEIETLTSKVEHLERRLLPSKPVAQKQTSAQKTIQEEEAPIAKPSMEAPDRVDAPADLPSETDDALFEPATSETAPPEADAPPLFEPVTTTEHIEAPARPRPPKSRSFSEDPIGAGVEKIKDFILGGNLFGRLGVAVLFIGLSFLIKEAIQYGLFPIELRLAAAFATGTLMIILGWRLTGKRPGYGLTMQGGGIAILYLTIFAGFRLYELLGAQTAFIILALITILGTVIAVLQNAQSLAVISILGGFLAPVITSTGEGNHVTLFSYYAVLNAGILSMAWKKPWRGLHLTGFFSTFAIATIWGGLSYKSELFNSTEPFLALFFLMYFGISMLYALRHGLEPKKIVDGTLIFGLPVIAFTLQAVLVEPFEYGLAWSALLMGGFYAGAAWLLHKRNRELLRTLVEALAGISMALLSMTIPFAFDATWVGTGWALEGAALIWLGIRQKRLLVRLSGLALMALATVFFIEGFKDTSYDAFQAYLFMLNPSFMGFLAISASALFAGYQINTHRDRILDIERFIPFLLLIVGLIAWIAGGYEEIRREFSSPHRLHLQVVFVSLSMTGLAFLGRKILWNGLVRATLMLLPVLYFMLLITQLELSHAFVSWGLLAWATAFASLYAVLFWVDKVDNIQQITPGITRIAHAAALWLFTWLPGSEAAWFIEDQLDIDGIWSVIGLVSVPTLIVYGVTRLTAREAWPIGSQRTAYMTTALIPVIAGVWCVTMYLTFNDAANPVPLPYIPLLNPLDILLGLFTGASIYWFRRMNALDPDYFNPSSRQVLKWGLIATGFIWMNATIARTVHHWGDIPYSGILIESSAFQSAISICWTLLALSVMVYAAKKSSRIPWVVSATLLGIVIVKMFVIDLSNLTTAHRVISFIGVGILLLIVGYLAPVPPKTEDRVSEALES